MRKIFALVVLSAFVAPVWAEQPAPATTTPPCAPVTVTVPSVQTDDVTLVTGPVKANASSKLETDQLKKQAIVYAPEGVIYLPIGSQLKKECLQNQIELAAGETPKKGSIYSIGSVVPAEVAARLLPIVTYGSVEITDGKAASPEQNTVAGQNFELRLRRLERFVGKSNLDDPSTTLDKKMNEMKTRIDALKIPAPAPPTPPVVPPPALVLPPPPV